MDRTSRAYLAALVGALAFVALLAILTMASGHASAKTVTLTSDASGKENLVANAIDAVAGGGADPTSAQEYSDLRVPSARSIPKRAETPVSE